VADVVALDLPGGAAFVRGLQRAWERGAAVLPLDPRLPGPARARLLDALRPTAIVDADGERRLGGVATADGDALVVPTSGTTGGPKGVVLTHDAVAASAVASSRRLGVDAGDRWLACLPLAHVGGLAVVTRALHTRTPLTVLPGFDEAAVTAAARAGCTLVSLVTAALRRIDPSLFRRILLGGGRPPEDRPPNAIATYGMTESGSGVVYDGRPLDGVELRLAPDGEILLRAPMLLRCYRDVREDGAVERPALDADGWFHTDDAGSWLPDGRLQVDGRRGDVIVTGGEKVWPDAVERVLATHPDVREVAVVGVADDDWGARVVAVVVPAEVGRPPSLGALRDHVRAALPAFAAPKEVRHVASLPRTASGKVERHRLLPRG